MVPASPVVATPQPMVPASPVVATPQRPVATHAAQAPTVPASGDSLWPTENVTAPTTSKK
jgi:hypothetical protein